MPETIAFGGAAGMGAAHALFHHDSRLVLQHLGGRDADEFQQRSEVAEADEGESAVRRFRRILTTGRAAASPMSSSPGCPAIDLLRPPPPCRRAAAGCWPAAAIARR
ncbi:lantibiotic dehydratase C-terminal domain-containing protein [Actinomadura luteofluorescens]|uniref:lantibiotic dehydratase C-terminal domain-containing protein n=1 Tax=Actinomadura luteofluorescens TaxID=46163 RepID=UPI0035E43EE4